MDFSQPATSVLPAKILVADDEPAVSADLKRFLSRQGHDVTVVDDGRKALQILQQTSGFDLVLLDVKMPGLEGLELLKIMKQDSRLQTIPVIMISGMGDNNRVVRCIADGAEDYLHKPVDHILLGARIGSCLRRIEAEKNKYRQYFSHDLAHELACGDDLLRTREADVSILFCDIRQFSAISERVGPATTIELISETMGRLSEIVFKFEGTLTEYIGDGLMAMWGAPKPLGNHADLSVRAGLEMIEALGPLNETWEKRLGEPIRLGVGINSGEVQVGVISLAPKFKYGPLGPTVNLASRVEGVTKYLK